MQKEKNKIRRSWVGYRYKEKKSSKIKIKIENNGEVVGFRTSYTKNMPNHWFMSIVLTQFWFIFLKNIKKVPKRALSLSALLPTLNHQHHHLPVGLHQRWA